MHMKFGAGLACVVGFVVAGTSWGATRYVNVSNASPASPYASWATAATNIQQAIDWSDSGDEVWVAPGVYRATNTVEIPLGKALTLRSTVSRGAVMDAQNRSLVLMVRGVNSWVDGFTIQNGSNTPAYGGGIYLAAASTVSNCLVVSNRAYGGAGIHVYASGTRILNCTIQKNRADAVGGGVLFYNHSTGHVANSEISFNTASNDGGGIYMQYAGTASNCWIVDNQVTAGRGGGGFLYYGGKVVNSVVVANEAATLGGGIYAYNQGGTIVHCTVVDNASGNEGGGIWMANTCTAFNNIVYFNVAPTSANLYAFLGTVSNNCTIPAAGGGCVTNSPQFIYRSTRTLTLQGTSPCIDAGANAYRLATDYLGNPRPVAGTEFGEAKVDIGAYEFQAGWDAGYRDLGGGWRRLTWFGDYAGMGGGWIWHNKHGFMYPTPASTRSDIWFYTQDMGWLWTANATYPYLYRSSDGAWLWYNGSANPRWFRNMTVGTWEHRP